MNTSDTPAFPSPGYIETHPGMSLRAYIATAALQGMCANSSIMWDNAKQTGLYSSVAVAMADALIAELNITTNIPITNGGSRTQQSQ